VRSLESVRFEKPAPDFSPPHSLRPSEIFSGAARFPTTTSLLTASASPLARFLYNSETNLSQLADSQMNREQPLLSLMPGESNLAGFKNKNLTPYICIGGIRSDNPKVYLHSLTDSEFVLYDM
jgi:hypothetical protein